MEKCHCLLFSALFLCFPIVSAAQQFHLYFSVILMRVLFMCICLLSGDRERILGYQSLHNPPTFFSYCSLPNRLQRPHAEPCFAYHLKLRCCRNQAKLQQNLMYLAAIADSQPPQTASLSQVSSRRGWPCCDSCFPGVVRPE